MWIFTILGDWAVHAIFTIGVLGLIGGFVLGFIPFINRYKLPIQIISILVFTLGTYLEGGLANEAIWRQRSAEAQIAVAKSEAKSAEKNVEIQTKVVENTKVIREKGDTQIKYVDRFRDREVLKTVEGPERVKLEKVIEYVERCPVPQELVDAYNESTVRPPKK